MRNARRKPKSSVILVMATALLLLAASTALAQTGGDYNLTWHTVDGGGGAVSGGGYTLAGTAGQPEPGPALTGGDYILYSGFWPGAGVAEYKIYLPLVLRNS